MSRDVPSDAGLLWDNFALLDEVIKERLSLRLKRKIIHGSLKVRSDSPHTKLYFLILHTLLFAGLNQLEWKLKICNLRRKFN